MEMNQILLNQIAAGDTLERAYHWLIANHTNTELPAWEILKPQLQTQLLSGEYCFQPVTLVHTTNRLGEPETQEIWHAQDQLVLKAISLVLKDHLKHEFSSCCHHLEGRGGIKKAVRETRDYVQAHPQSWVMKTDVQGYYAYIDHLILHQQLWALLPEETYLQRLFWQYLKRSVYDGGNYSDIERGISLGCPLSTLMAALYLKPLDDLLENSKLFYARFMDDFVVIAPTRWNLPNRVAEIQAVLGNLKLEQVAEKTVITRTDQAFDFLGYHFAPISLTVAQKTLQRRDARMARLYKQGASDERKTTPNPLSNYPLTPSLGRRGGNAPFLSKEWVVDSYLRGNDKTFEPNRMRVESARYSFEAKLLALGSTSLLATTAMDSHATIYQIGTNILSHGSPDGCGVDVEVVWGSPVVTSANISNCTSFTCFGFEPKGIIRTIFLATGAHVLHFSTLMLGRVINSTTPP